MTPACPLGASIKSISVIHMRTLKSLGNFEKQNKCSVRINPTSGQNIGIRIFQKSP